MLRHIDYTGIFSRRLLKYVPVLTFAILYVYFNFSPSSYGCGLKMLGAQNSGIIAGQCEPWRSDEYLVLTPYFQISVLNNFGPIDNISPYKEKLISFFALPTLDWGLIFRPQLWLFHVLSPAKAYSAYWLLLMASMLASTYYLLKFANIQRIYAALGALILFFSQFIQGWWTMNAGVFAFIGWIGVALLVNTSSLRRFILVFVTSVITLFSYLYPAFLIAGALAIGAFVFAASPRRFFDWRFLLSAGVGLLAAIACASAYYADLYLAMRDTVYPGRWEEPGGGVTLVQLISHIFPYITSTGATFTGAGESALSGINKIEIGVIGSWLPILGMVFVKPDSITLTLKNSRWFLVTMSAVMIVLGLWMTSHWLDAVFSFTGLNRMSSRRAVYGFGLAFFLTQIYLMPKFAFEYNHFRFAIFALIVLMAGLVSALAAQSSGQYDGSLLAIVWNDRRDYVVLVPTILIILWRWHLFRLDRSFNLSTSPLPLFLIACFTSLITFGLLNPVQSTRTIFDKPDSTLIRALDTAKEVMNNSNALFAVEGAYGALLPGLGYRVINHTLLYPQLKFFRSIFPEEPFPLFLNVFNRYSHVVVLSKVQKPTNGIDTILVPAAAFQLIQLCQPTLPIDFDAKRYLELNPDVAAAGVDGAIHYLQHGCKENRRFK